MTPTPVDLKNCPFCGGKAILDKTTNGHYWLIRCLGCRLELPDSWGDAKQAIDAWNTRPTPAMETMEELRGEIVEQTQKNGVSLVQDNHANDGEAGYGSSLYDQGVIEASKDAICIINQAFAKHMEK